MKGLLERFFGVSIATTLLLFAALTAAEIEYLPITIQVSPNVLNIQSEGEVVTVHTDIPYGRVISATVTLNYVPINYSKSDNQGYFVAKFLMEEVKALAPDELEIGALNELTLTGLTSDGFVFAGADDVLVLDNVPQGRR